MFEFVPQARTLTGIVHKPHRRPSCVNLCPPSEKTHRAVFDRRGLAGSRRVLYPPFDTWLAPSTQGSALNRGLRLSIEDPHRR